MKRLVHGAINALVVACAFRRPIRFFSGFVDGMASPNGGKKDLKTSNFACRKKKKQWWASQELEDLFLFWM